MGAAREVRPSDEDIEAAALAERAALPLAGEETVPRARYDAVLRSAARSRQSTERFRCALYCVAGRLGADGPDEVDRWIEAWAKGEDATTDRSRSGCDPVRFVGRDEPLEEPDEEPIARITDVSIEPVVGYPPPDGSEVIRAELAPGDRVRHPAQLRVGDRLSWRDEHGEAPCEVTNRYATHAEVDAGPLGPLAVNDYVCSTSRIRLVSRVVTDPSTLRPGDVLDAGLRPPLRGGVDLLTVVDFDADRREVHCRGEDGTERWLFDVKFARSEVRLVERAPEHPEHHVVVAGSYRQAREYAREHDLADPRRTRVATRARDLIGLNWRGLTIHLASVADLTDEMQRRISVLHEQGAQLACDVTLEGVRGCWLRLRDQALEEHERRFRERRS